MSMAAIYLRPITDSDTQYIVKWRNKKRVRRNFIYREPFTGAIHETWMREKVAEGTVVQFIICEQKNDRPIGSVYFRDVDVAGGEAEYGIFIGEKDALGRGCGSAAAKLAVAHAFDAMGLKKLILRVFTDNEAAIKSYKKAGFKVTQRLPQVVCSDGERKDMYLMEQRKEDWNRKLVSFVIPCYRSAETLPGVVEEIKRAMKTLPYEFELILVNDCSPDQTFQVIETLCRENERMTGINLSRNFGQHAALMAGFGEAKGDIIICLDDDGQTPADEAYRLLEAIEQGADVVYAKYEHKKHSLFRNFGSMVNEWMAMMLLGKPKSLYVSSYFAARRFVVKEMLRYVNPYPYVIGLVLRTTKNIVNVTVQHREREVGASGYTFSKLFGLWFNGFTAFSVRPLRMATAVGCFFSVLGFVYGIYTIVKKLINPAVPMGFSSMMSAIVFIGGMTILLLGLLGEYIGRIYISMNNAPQYVVKEKISGKCGIWEETEEGFDTHE